MQIKFVDYGYRLAEWCVERLEASGLHDLKLLDTLMVGQKRLLLHFKEMDKDYEIYIQRTASGVIPPTDYFRFVVVESGLVTFENYSAEFSFVEEDPK